LLKTFEQHRGDLLFTNNADNPAHRVSPSFS
jgi:hypothetical protein